MPESYPAKPMTRKPKLTRARIESVGNRTNDDVLTAEHFRSLRDFGAKYPGLEVSFIHGDVYRLACIPYDEKRTGLLIWHPENLQGARLRGMVGHAIRWARDAGLLPPDGPALLAMREHMARHAAANPLPKENA